MIHNVQCEIEHNGSAKIDQHFTSSIKHDEGKSEREYKLVPQYEKYPFTNRHVTMLMIIFILILRDMDYQMRKRLHD